MNHFSSDYVKKEIDKIDVPEEKLNIAIQNALECSIKSSFKKKLIYYSCAAGVLISLFIGSTFISPAMATIASKVPYLSQFFESKPITEIIHEELLDKGYSIQGIGMVVKRKTISVTIEGSEKYYKDVKNEVEKKVEELLKSRGYDAFKVEVVRYIYEPVQISEEQKKEEELMNQIFNELKKQNYNVLTVGILERPKRLEVDVPNTEERIEEIKLIISDILENRGEDSMRIKINQIDLEKRDRDSRWAQITSIVGNGLLSKKEFKVTGIAYSVFPEPELNIKTSIKSSDSNAKEQAEKLEKLVEEFLKSKEAEDLIKNDSYIINVLSKDKKKIN